MFVSHQHGQRATFRRNMTIIMAIMVDMGGTTPPRLPFYYDFSFRIEDLCTAIAASVHMVHAVAMHDGNLLVKEITTEIGAFAFCHPLTVC
jgi:hypothetical protein